MKRYLTSIAAILLLFALPTVLSAQNGGDSQGYALSKAPYRVGERLTYNVSFSNFFSAAHLELFVAGRGIYFDRDGLTLRLHVETIGAVNAALFSINNDFVSYVDPTTGQPYRAQQVRREAGRDNVASLEYNTPEGATAIAPKTRSNEFPGTYDVISALYRLRALPLSKDSRYSFTVAFNDDYYNVDLRVRGREIIKTNVGSFSTIVTQLRFPNNSELDDYGTRVYFTDDERHVPILLTARIPSGDIRAELVGSELPGVMPAAPDPNLPKIAIAPAEAPAIPGARTNVPVSPAGPNNPARNIPGIPNNIATPNKGAPLSPLPAGLPFSAGEQLNFSIYLGDVPQPVGAASFQVKPRMKYFGRDAVLLAARAQTTGATQSFFVADDEVNSYVDVASLLPFRVETIVRETRRKSNQTVLIDQDRGSATFDAGSRVDVPNGTYDPISAFYALRSFNLNSGKANAISLLVNNRPRTLVITFIKRETIELGGQRIPALQLSLTTDDPQGDRNGLRLWVSDDQRRLPLRLTVITPAGKVRADLAIIALTNQ